MIENKKLVRATYTNEIFGDIRLIYNFDANEVLVCARDVAKAFGFADPSRSVRDICISPVKESHITEGGLQVLNFITRDDFIRLFKHSKSEKCYSCFAFIETIVNDFTDKVIEKYCSESDDYDADYEDEDDDDDVCYGNCEQCDYFDECYPDEDDETSEEFNELIRKHTTEEKDIGDFDNIIEAIEAIGKVITNDGIKINKVIIYDDCEPVFVIEKIRSEDND